MKRINSKPQSRRCLVCPQCDKSRMIRDLDHAVSRETRAYKAKDGTEIELLVDICEFCKQRNSKKFFEPSKADIRKVLKTMQEDAALNENDSLEDLL